MAPTETESRALVTIAVMLGAFTLFLGLFVREWWTIPFAVVAIVACVYAAAKHPEHRTAASVGAVLAAIGGGVLLLFG